MRESELPPGHILLGKLEVVRRLGGGGMGVVYEVEHRLTGHRRALKVVRARYADRPRFMKRLLREAKVAGTLDTPHVVETYDAGRLEDGSAYVLMELLEGRSLYEAMQQSGQIEPQRLASIMAQVAEGMSLAHEAGIVHRDLKPENVFLLDDEQGDERVKILDFGVSKFELSQRATRLTAEGTLVGTPYYMSPEQASGKAVDARTDVYAMGVMLYEGLVGKLPFEGDTVGELFVKISAGECVPLRLRRPDLDPRWFELVHRALHKERDSRHPSSEALRRELLPLASGDTTKRAKTISDGGKTTDRGTHAYEHVPPPPRAPRELVEAAARAPADGPPARDSEESGPVASAPPPAPERPGIPGWMWALGGAALVVAVLLPFRLLSSDPASSEPDVQPTAAAPEPEPAPEAEVEPEEEEAAPEPVATVTVDAGAIDEPETPPRPPPLRATDDPASPATAAGLDPNPYR